MGKPSSAETAKKIQLLLKEDGLDVRADAARLDELRRVFAALVSSGDLDAATTAASSTVSSTQHHQQQWRTFLKNSHDILVHQLAERVQSGQITAVRTLWGVIAATPAKSTSGVKLIDCNLLHTLIKCMATVDLRDKQVRHMLEAEFLGPYRDVQYYMMLTIAAAANELYPQKKKNSQLADGLVELLMMIPLAASKKELESSSSSVAGGYLFPPPVDVVPDADISSDSESNDDDFEEELDSEVDSEDGDERPAKRAKSEKKRFAFMDVNQQRAAWSKAWLAVLRLKLSENMLKQALRFVPVSVLPVATNPLRFADFCMNAYSGSSDISVVPLLALEGLYFLMTQNGLEYPEFYKQLYKLVMSPSLLYVKHRTQFCRLLDKCLSRNDMLPAHLVAAFVKRLLRSALSAPPSSCLFVLALCSNLIRKHPETACLVHRQRQTESDNGKGGLEDGFDDSADDPEHANALQSSLWELGALERHYYPAVVTLAKSIGREEELQTPLYSIEDFVAGHTYGTLFEQERNRRKRRNMKTPLTFHKPAGLFVENDVFAGILATPKSSSRP